MEEKSNLTAERSLEIIRESIERSQRTINKNSAIPLIWWGLCVIIFSLFIAYLWKNHGGPIWNMLWAILWIVGLAGDRIIDKRRERVPTTFVGNTISYVWATFGVFCCGVRNDFRLYLQRNVAIGANHTQSVCRWLYHQHHLPVFWDGYDHHRSGPPQPYHSSMWSYSRIRWILRGITLPRPYTTLCDGRRCLDRSDCARCGNFYTK